MKLNAMILPTADSSADIAINQSRCSAVDSDVSSDFDDGLSSRLWQLKVGLQPFGNLVERTQGHIPFFIIGSDGILAEFIGAAIIQGSVV